MEYLSYKPEWMDTSGFLTGIQTDPYFEQYDKGMWQGQFPLPLYDGPVLLPGTNGEDMRAKVKGFGFSVPGTQPFEIQKNRYALTARQHGFVNLGGWREVEEQNLIPATYIIYPHRVSVRLGRPVRNQQPSQEMEVESWMHCRSMYDPSLSVWIQARRRGLAQPGHGVRESMPAYLHYVPLNFSFFIEYFAAVFNNYAQGIGIRPVPSHGEGRPAMVYETYDDDREIHAITHPFITNDIYQFDAPQDWLVRYGHMVDGFVQGKHMEYADAKAMLQSFMDLLHARHHQLLHRKKGY